MNEQTATGMTDTELDAFAGRIADWAGGLTTGERDLWDAMLVRAATPRDDVSGHIIPLSLSKGLESQDKLGNFEIQRLMSAYNQAETLASTVLRKQAQTNAGIIRNI